MGHFGNERLDEVVAAIVPLMPSLDEFYRFKGQLSTYSRGVMHHEVNDVHRDQQRILKKIISERLACLFSADEHEAISLPALSSDAGLVAGIVDHQKLMSNPVQLSVPLVSCFSRLMGRPETGDILAFATSAVALSEPFNRRAIWLSGHRINLFAQRQKDDLLFSAPVNRFDLIERAKASKCWHRLSGHEKALLEFVTHRIESIDLGGCRGLSDQLTKINFHLWPLLFAPAIRDRMPNLVQLDIEDVAARYLVHLIEHEPGAFVVRMLLEPEFREDVLTSLDGLVGGWDTDRGLGSHFFWAHRDARRVSLQLRGDTLCRTDTGEAFPITRSTLVEELESRRWFPGQIITLLMFIFVAGMKPVTGWSLEFVRRLRVTVAGILSRHAPDEAERIFLVPLDNMNLMSILKRKRADGSIEDQSAFDIMLRGGITQDYLEAIDAIEFNAFLAPSLVATYHYAVDKYGSTETRANRREFDLSTADLHRPLGNLSFAASKGSAAG
jgi:hypothetical protein